MENEQPVGTADPTKCVAVEQNGTCPNCGWKWGDPKPHQVFFGSLRNEPPPVAKAEPVPKASDPNACVAVSITQTCPKCGWNYEEEMKGNTPRPHPIAPPKP